jgi:hypothetical protein
MVWRLAVLVSVDILRPWSLFNQAVGRTRNTMQDIHLLSSKQILGLPPTPASPHCRDDNKPTRTDSPVLYSLPSFHP